jgi:hypothetical protein
VQYKTFAALKLEVQSETDTEAEDFVTATEIMAYFQEAVDECAAHIYKVWPLATNYFEKLTQFDLTVGQQLLTLPTDMYARSILRMVFNGNGKVFPIHRFNKSKRFEEIAEISQFNSTSDYYKYTFIDDGSLNTHQAKLWPASKDEGTGIIWLWYVREPIQIVDDTSLIDIPEFYYYIKSYVKWKIYGKEGSPLLEEALADRNEKRALMLETLAEMTPDDDNLLEGDYSHYEEMS